MISGIFSEVAHMYPAYLIDTRVVALLGLRTRRGLISSKVQDDRLGRQTLGA